VRGARGARGERERRRRGGVRGFCFGLRKRG
jgi:hypothetical protein